MLIVAALSARWLAEMVARAGVPVMALDSFGDADTRACATHWQRLPAHPSPARLISALQRAHAGAGAPVQGWIAGPGLEGTVAALDADTLAALPPLLGNPPAAVRATRDPDRFFGTLRRLGLPHPASRYTPPDDPAGWLSKDLAGSGGHHIRAASRRATAASGSRFWQRRVEGIPASVLFVANGRRGRVLAHQHQWVRAMGARPFVFEGLIGPLPPPAALATEIAQAVDQLSAEFGLFGLNSLDLMLTPGGGWQILELNPRPSASLQLYPEWPLLSWHRQTCAGGPLPDLEPLEPGLRGWQIVHAPDSAGLAAGQDALHAVHRRPGVQVHDIAPPGTPMPAPGQPWLSLSATGTDTATVQARLDAFRSGATAHPAPTAQPRSHGTESPPCPPHPPSTTPA